MQKSRIALLAAAALLATLALMPVTAQPPSFTQTFQVRGAVGDIPTTDNVEPAGAWNLDHRLTATYSNTSSEDDRTFRFAIPAGARVVNLTCDCADWRSTQTPRIVTFTLGTNNPSGQHTIRVTTSQPYDSTVGFSVFTPLEVSSLESLAVILYVPRDAQLTAPVKMSGQLTTTDGSSTIEYVTFASGQSRPLDLWFAIHPDNAIQAEPTISWNAGLIAAFLLIGVGIGAVLWSWLVAQGLVQRKGRKQVAATAAHVEAAAKDPVPVLEGKKRALLAALKDLELAKQGNEVSLEVYDVVKADLKKQAVTVMRALEAATPGDQTAGSPRGPGNA
jgi:hypothetical protein